MGGGLAEQRFLHVKKLQLKDNITVKFSKKSIFLLK